MLKKLLLNAVMPLRLFPARNYKNTEMYLQRLIVYIDRGIPVVGGNMRGMFVGYEDYGKTLLQLTGDINEPERITIDKATDAVQWHGYEYKSGWVFVGDKKKIFRLPKSTAGQ